MAVPLRSNIFRPSSPERAHFQKFPVQVAVLFSPSDEAFSSTLRDAFLHLDQLTGDDVVFFAVLDPPTNWLRLAARQPWWNAYHERVGALGQVGFSMDDATLVHELARLFHMSWSALPAIAVGTDLWSGELVTSPTSPVHLPRQLEALTRLVRERGRPTIEQVDDTLSEAAEAEGRIYTANPDWSQRLGDVYQVLETAEQPGQPQSRIIDLLPRELAAALAPLSRARRVASGAGPDDPASAHPLVLAAIEDAAGRLVPAATVARRLQQRLNEPRHSQFMAELDEESAIMIDQSLRVGDLIERSAEAGAQNGRAPWTRPPGGRGARWPDGPRWMKSEDYAPGAVGIWKAFEREVNLSVIQAARQSRSIPMPRFFARFAPLGVVPVDRCQVTIGQDRRNQRPIVRNINLRDRESRTNAHVFLTIGDARGVAQALSGQTNEDFDAIVEGCLGDRLPPRLLPTWEAIGQIRNRGSHTEPLTRAEYSRVLELVLDPATIEPLVRIKQIMAGRVH